MDKNGKERGSVLMEALICLPVLLLISLGVGQFAHIWLCRQVVQYAAFCGARAVLPAGTHAVQAGNVRMTEEEAAALYAARRICALISFTQSAGQPEFQRNWLKNNAEEPGILGGSGGVYDSIRAAAIQLERSSGQTTLPCWQSGKVAVAVAKPGGNNWSRAVTVRMDVPMLFPFAGQIMGKVFSLYSRDGVFGIYDIKENSAALNPADRSVLNLDYKELANYFFPHIRLYETAVIGKPFLVTTTGNLPEINDVWRTE